MTGRGVGESALARLLGRGTRAIVVYGHARGGTNILWNLIGAHPEVVMTQNELNELFGGSIRRRLARKLPWLLRAPAFRNAMADAVVASVARSLAEPVIGERAPGSMYTAADLSTCIICYKGVNLDVGCHQALTKLHDRVAPILLLRHPAAVIAGHMRRGWPFQRALARYLATLQSMERLALIGGGVFVDFDAMIANPMQAAGSLYAHLGLRRPEPLLLKVKAKRRMTDAGHRIVDGLRERQHYWCDGASVATLIDRSVLDRVINDLELIERLPVTARARFPEALSRYERMLART